VALATTQISVDPSPQPNAPAGVYSITGTFANNSSSPFTNLYFIVTQLTGGNLLLNADGGPGGVGARLSVPSAALGSDGVLIPGESFSQLFRIGLQQNQAFSFRVDLYAGGGGPLPDARLATLATTPTSIYLASIRGTFNPVAMYRVQVPASLAIPAPQGPGVLPALLTTPTPAPTGTPILSPTATAPAIAPRATATIVPATTSPASEPSADRCITEIDGSCNQVAPAAEPPPDLDADTDPDGNRD
jgi:hypothetical protein